MRRGITAAAVIAAALAMTATACSSSKSGDGSGKGPSGVFSTDGKGKTVDIWLQSDPKKTPDWLTVVNQANAEFEKETGAKVKMDWQTDWSTYGAKLDSTFAGSTGIPDVVELGNTMVAAYIAGGALTDLTAGKSKFDNSGTWLQGLTDAGTSPDGKLEAVPYYAGTRVVIYRKDMFAKAGITSPPTTLDELYADGQKLKATYANDPRFSAFYMPGKYWYAAMSMVYGAGGKIADQQNGKWQGELESPQAQQGLANWAKLATEYSVGGKTTDENTPPQANVFAQGHTAMIWDNGWEVGQITDPKAGNPKLADDIGTFTMPNTPGQNMSSFLGGSNLAVPKKATNPGLGAEWIRIYTDTANMTAMAKASIIPNTTSLLGAYEGVSDTNKVTGEAVRNTWMTPNTPNWQNVESGLILQNMLESIATGKSSIADAAKAADAKIASTLNGN